MHPIIQIAGLSALLLTTACNMEPAALIGSLHRRKSGHSERARVSHAAAIAR